MILIMLLFIIYNILNILFIYFLLIFLWNNNKFSRIIYKLSTSVLKFVRKGKPDISVRNLRYE